MKGFPCIWLAMLSLSPTQGDHRYQSPDYGTLEIAGVCAVDTENARCWDPTGKASPKVTEIISAYFLTNSNSDLRLRFRKKNRLIVMRCVEARDTSAYLSGELTSSSGFSASNSGQIGHQRGEETYKLFWMYPSAEEKTTDLFAYLELPMRATTSLALKEGAEAQLEGYTFKVLNIRENPTVTAVSYANQGKSWRIGYEVTGGDPEQRPRFNAQPVDSKGAPITAVDKNGNPSKPKPPEGGGHFYPIFGQGYNEGALTSWQSAISPDKISKLILSGSTRRKMTFKNVALDPVE